MLAEGWKGLVWFVTGVAVALGLLLVPLQVAAERKKLDKTVSEIADAGREIRSLQTEFDTRSNLAQLEKWNGDTLGLVSPTANQYVRDAAQLASLDMTQPLEPGKPGLQTAAYVVPTLPGVMPTSAQPAETTPSSVAAPATAPAASAAPAAMAAVATREAPRATLHLASLARPVAPARNTQTMAMLDRKLLSDTTMGDLLSEARVEARSR